MDLTAATDTDVRRIAIHGDSGRVDVVVPATRTVGEALSGAGVAFAPDSYLAVSRHGVHLDPDAPVASLDDGALITIINMSTPPPPRGRAVLEAPSTRSNYHSLWWILASASILLTAGTIASISAGEQLVNTSTTRLAAGAVAVLAFASAVLWVRRAGPHPGGRAIALLTPTLLIFCAGAAATPVVYRAVQLAVTVGLLMSAVVGYSLAIAARARGARAIAVTSANIFVVLAAVWALALIFDWSTVTAAALSFALVAPAIKSAPASVLDLPEGYFLEYGALMSSRWTVRGAVPPPQGDITMPVVKPYVDESSARVAVTTVLFSVVAVLCAPALIHLASSPAKLISIAAIVAVLTTVVALLLQPRRGTPRYLRWVPRSAAIIISIMGATDIASGDSLTMRLAVAGAALAVGIVTVIASLPIAKGAPSLVWSRIADSIEALSIALAPAAAVLAAGTLDLVRAMVSG